MAIKPLPGTNKKRAKLPYSHYLDTKKNVGRGIWGEWLSLKQLQAHFGPLFIISVVINLTLKGSRQRTPPTQ